MNNAICHGQQFCTFTFELSTVNDLNLYQSSKKENVG